jgi:NodT family efflux transporter outer membrane factor (OMF) lipoprotein
MTLSRVSWRSVCLAALSCCLLLSCAVKQAPTVREMTEALPETTQIPQRWKAPAPGAAGGVADGWLESFGDPRLEALVEEALRNNPSLRAAATQVDVAAGYATQASAQLWPISSIQGMGGAKGRFKYKRTTHKDYAKETALFFNVSWELDLWGKVRSQAAAARENLAAVEADVEWGRQSLAALVAKTYTLAAEIRQLVKIQERAVELYEKSVEILKVKRDVGQVSDLAVASEELALADARADLLQLKMARQNVARALEVLLGRYPAAELEAPAALAPLPPPLPAGIPSEVLGRRPDLVAAERQVAAAFHLVQTAKLARLPSFAFVGSTGNQGSEVTKALGIPLHFWSMALNLLIPLFTGGALESQVDIQNAEQEAALSLFIQSALTAFQEVETGLDTESGLLEQRRELEAGLQDSRRAFDLAKIKYEIGETDYLPVIDQEGNVLTAEADLLEVDYALIHNRISLCLALGGSYQERSTP